MPKTRCPSTIPARGIVDCASTLAFVLHSWRPSKSVVDLSYSLNARVQQRANAIERAKRAHHSLLDCCNAMLDLRRDVSSCAGAGADARMRASRSSPSLVSADSTGNTESDSEDRVATSDAPQDTLRESVRSAQSLARGPQKFLTKPAPRGRVPSERVRDIVSRERRELDLPCHCARRRAVFFTSSQLRLATSLGSASRSSSSCRCQSGTGTLSGDAAKLAHASSMSWMRSAGGSCSSWSSMGCDDMF